MTFAIIPCRMGSKRFYGKPLEEIKEMPMYWGVYRSVVECELVDGVVVATEDFLIAKDCLSEHVPCVATSSARTGTDRCAEAAKNLGLKTGIVLNVQGDEPMIRSSHIRQVLSMFDDYPKTEVATLV